MSANIASKLIAACQFSAQLLRHMDEALQIIFDTGEAERVENKACNAILRA